MTVREKEKLLQGLQICSNDAGIPNQCEVFGCPYFDGSAWCRHELAKDAWNMIYELNKQLAPRLLSIEEIHRGMVVWLEDVGKADLLLAIGGASAGDSKCFIGENDMSIAAKDIEYNIRWRAWINSKPSEKQREEKAWKKI